MRKTKHPATAMCRLAEVMGWDIKSEGKQWVVTSLPGPPRAACFGTRSPAEGLKFTAIGLLCLMTRVAMSSPAIGGDGLTGPEIQELIQFTPEHIYSAQAGRHFLTIDGKIPATDETTMYRAYFNQEGVDNV